MMHIMDAIAVEANDVSVYFGRKAALDSLTFRITKGTSTALVGPNGSGKTTLLRLIAGLQQASSGQMRVASSQVAYVLQHSGRGNWLPITVAEVIAMGRYPHTGIFKRLSAKDKRAINNAAERVEIADLFSAQMGELSGGQKQRVLIAQALAQEADLLLLDEPITGLDLASQDRILKILGDETHHGRTVIVSTHHLEEAHECDVVFLLAAGLVAAGLPDEVLVPDVLDVAYGSRLLRLDKHTTLMDEHGH